MPHEPADRLDVLLILGAYQLRGSYARSLSLIERMPSDRIRLQLVATDQVRLPRPQPLDLKVSRYLNWPAVGLVARHFLEADLRDNPPDVIDVQHRGVHPLGAWLARQLQRPYTVTVHDYLRDRERFVVDPVWCRRIIAVSESVRCELLDRTGLPEDMVTVISSGVQPPEEAELSHILKQGCCPVIGTTGALEAGKGLEHFLRAAVLVLKRFPDAMFVIAGSGPQERSLRQMSVQLGLSESLTILPNLLDFVPALKAMDVFVLPALKQGLGSTMLEAMARGLPVIGTESGGVFSVIVDEETGFLVPPSNADALAERICELLNNPEGARQMGAAARRRVFDHFHVSRMVDMTATLYRQIAEEAISRQQSAVSRG